MSSTTPNFNKNYQQNDGKSSTFGRNLMSFIRDRLPYASVINDDSLNSKYKIFKQLGGRRAEALAKHSISSSNQYNNTPLGNIAGDNSFSEIMYAGVDENKGGRLRDYRTMAAFSEVADALDEICDEIINVDEKDEVAKIKIKKHKTDIDTDDRSSIEEQFQRFIEYFDLKNRGWQYFRQFLIEGELFFELIVHENHLSEGVLGVINLPSELIDPVYNNIQNMLVKGFLYRKPIFDKNNPTKIEKIEYIPLEENQIVYINSGVYNESKTMIVPFLENARRPYRQLSLIEDAIVIHRLVRAPERLVFNVDVGTMAPTKAEAYLKKLMQNYWARKTFDLDQNDVVKKFNPQSMLDSFWFAKRQGSEGTNVTQLPGSSNLGELSDLMYFVKKLYRSLKVPTTRLDPDEAFRDGTDILREELKFAKFIIRQQQRFAAGIKKAFITHLKLIGRNSESEVFSEIRETDIEIEFNVPSNFYELRENQKLQLKAEAYNSLANGENISTTYSQKRYLGWSDKDILANRAYLRKDKEFQWELMQIEQFGPAWKEMLALQQAGGGEEAEGMGDIGGAFGGGGGIPEFGGAPAETGLEGGDAGGEAQGPQQFNTPAPTGGQEPIQ